MFHIALCDDEAAQRQLTHELLDSYFSERGAVAKIREFSDASGLLNAVLDETFDLYLLDIVMPEMDGINLGLSLRKFDENGVIIYLTTTADFALEGYSVRASAYLLKPVSREKLFFALDDALKIISNRSAQSVLVKTADGTVHLLLDDILYVEQLDRLPHYYLCDGSCVVGVTIRTSFQEAMRPLLTDDRFYLCGASFVFNLHHIKSVTKSNACIGSRQVPVPKRTAAELHTAWMHYWLEGGTQL